MLLSSHDAATADNRGVERSHVRGASIGRFLTDVVSQVRFALQQEGELVSLVERMQDRYQKGLAQQAPQVRAGDWGAGSGGARLWSADLAVSAYAVGNSSRVSSVAVLRPPMTPVASGRWPHCATAGVHTTAECRPAMQVVPVRRWTPKQTAQHENQRQRQDKRHAERVQHRQGHRLEQRSFDALQRQDREVHDGDDRFTEYRGPAVLDRRIAHYIQALIGGQIATAGLTRFAQSAHGSFDADDRAISD